MSEPIQRRAAAGLLGRLASARDNSDEDALNIIQSSNFKDITAYQFTMELSGLEFIEAISGGVEVGESNFGILDKNTVTTAWFSPEGVTTDQELFSLVFRTTEDVRLSDAFAISSRVTQAIAYTSNQQQLDVNFEYISNNDVSEFKLYQNTPNPFSESTSIGFNLVKSSDITLTIMDITGKQIGVKKGYFSKGYHEIVLQSSELGQSGVLYYQLEGEDFRETRKMILIE